MLEGANDTYLLEVIQDGNVVDPETGTINGRVPFAIKSVNEISVPVQGDNGDSYIEKNDWILLGKDKHFPKVNLTEFESDLMTTLPGEGEQKIGTAHLSAAGIKIVFDGYDNFFNGTGNNVTFNFEVEATADMSDVDYGETMTSKIFEQNYTFENPQIEAVYNLDLASTPTVSKTDKFDPSHLLALDGYTFVNDLGESHYNASKHANDESTTEVGKYVAGSFTINGESAEPVVVGDDSGGGTVSYTFPEDFGEKEAVITYKTWIPKAKYYSEFGDAAVRHTQLFNKFDLRNNDDIVGTSNEKVVKFHPWWIDNPTVTINPRDNPAEDPLTATWTVTVNRVYKKDLKNFTITNYWKKDNGAQSTALPDGFEFKSASYEVMAPGSSEWTPSGEVELNDGVFNIGDVNGGVRLTFTMNIDNAENGLNHHYQARANWLTGNGYNDNDLQDLGNYGLAGGAYQGAGGSFSQASTTKGVNLLIGGHTAGREVDLSEVEHLTVSEKSLKNVLELEIPYINIKQNILDESTDENLKIALTQIKQNQTPGDGNFTIAGHRGYRDGRHFSNLDKVPLGEIVYLHDQNYTYSYEVVSSEVIESTDIDILDDQAGKDEITLITCTVSGKQRLAVKGNLINTVRK